MSKTQILFHGGPLAGIVRTKSVPARLAHYLTHEGSSLPAIEGDRAMLRRGNPPRGRLPGIYILDEIENEKDGTRTAIYRYSATKGQL